jgi:hypothetical protein
MLTTTESTLSSEDRMFLTRETQPPHIIPVTSRRTGESLVCCWSWRRGDCGERISVVKEFDTEKFCRRIFRLWWMRRRFVGSRETKWWPWLKLKERLGGEKRESLSRWVAIIGWCK